MGMEGSALGNGRNNRKIWMGIGIGLFVAILALSLFFNLKGCLETRPPAPVVVTATPWPTEVPSETPRPHPTDTPVVIVVSATPVPVTNTPIPTITSLSTDTPIPTLTATATVLPSATPTISMPVPEPTKWPWDVTLIYKALSRSEGEDYQHFAAEASFDRIPSQAVNFEGQTVIAILLCSQQDYYAKFSYAGPLFENKTREFRGTLKADCPRYHWVHDTFEAKQIKVIVSKANLRTAGFVTEVTLHGWVGAGAIFESRQRVTAQNINGRRLWWEIFFDGQPLYVHEGLVEVILPVPVSPVIPTASSTPSATATPTVTGTPVPQARFELVNEEIVVSPDQEERIVIKNTGNKQGDFTGHQLVIIRFEDDKPILHYYRFPDEVDGRFMIVEPGKTITLYVQRQGVDSFLPEKGFVLYWKIAPGEKVFLDDVRGAIWLFKLRLTLPLEWDYLVDCFAYGRILDYKCP